MSSLRARYRGQEQTAFRERLFNAPEGNGGAVRRKSRNDRPKGRVTENDLCRETMLAHRQPRAKYFAAEASRGNSDKSRAAKAEAVTADYRSMRQQHGSGKCRG